MKPSLLRTGFSERVLAAYMDRPITRPLAWVILLASVVAIGYLDYVTGVYVSVAPFYLIPITLCTGWLGPWEGAAMVFICNGTRLVVDILGFYPKPLPAYRYWNHLCVSSAMFLLIVWLLHSLLALRSQLQMKVTERTEQLHESIVHRERLEREILDVGARERNAIGRELHDDLGQHLTATALAAQALAQQLGDQPSATKARLIVRWIEEGTAKARKLARGLLLAYIEPDRLAQELEELALGAGQGGIPCRLIKTGPTLVADGAECAQLFRIAQEALGNALRHAQPAAIEITLASDDNAVLLIVEDDGRGLGDQRSGGFGMHIMEHRAKLIGASLSFVSAPGEGTKVVCRLPKPAPVPA